jgi:septum site-determining protein MinC
VRLGSAAQRNQPRCHERGHPVLDRDEVVGFAQAARELVDPSGARERPLEPLVGEEKKKPEKPPEPAIKPTKIITSPVRGGQQIYAQGGDLVVISSVSPGAELLADGNIHVYGPMRGRALAGIKGDTKARIFCQQLTAELVSIAGQYKVSEDLRRDPLWGASVQVNLSGDVLNIIRL